MYIACNKFKVDTKLSQDFEQAWKDRNSYLKEMDGFRAFQLLKGEAQEDFLYYISKSDWESKQAFVAWTESDQFKQAHQRSNLKKGVLLGPPQFEGYEVILEV